MKEFLAKRKSLIIFTIVVFVLALLIFQPISNKGDYTGPNPVESRHAKMYTNIWIDPETGVNYIIYDDGYGGDMLVRRNTDGTPFVSEVK